MEKMKLKHINRLQVKIFLPFHWSKFESSFLPYLPWLSSEQCGRSKASFLELSSIGKIFAFSLAFYHIFMHFHWIFISRRRDFNFLTVWVFIIGFLIEPKMVTLEPRGPLDGIVCLKKADVIILGQKFLRKTLF